MRPRQLHTSGKLHFRMRLQIHHATVAGTSQQGTAAAHGSGDRSKISGAPPQSREAPKQDTRRQKRGTSDTATRKRHRLTKQTKKMFLPQPISRPFCQHTNPCRRRAEPCVGQLTPPPARHAKDESRNKAQAVVIFLPETGVFSGQFVTAFAAVTICSHTKAYARIRVILY